MVFPRDGVCHRCGWDAKVRQVRRGDRKLLQCGRAYGRLCQECVGDLLQIASSGNKVAPSRPTAPTEGRPARQVA